MRVRVVSRSGRELVVGGLDVQGPGVEDLKKAFHEASKAKKARARR